MRLPTAKRLLLQTVSASHVVTRASADEEDGDNSRLQPVRVQVDAQQVSSESGQVGADRRFKLPESVLQVEAETLKLSPVNFCLVANVVEGYPRKRKGFANLEKLPGFQRVGKPVGSGVDAVCRVGGNVGVCRVASSLDQSCAASEALFFSRPIFMQSKCRPRQSPVLPPAARAIAILGSSVEEARLAAGSGTTRARVFSLARPP